MPKHSQKPKTTEAKTKVTYIQGACTDALTLTIKIAQEKITALSIATSPASCSHLKKTAPLLKQHVLGKHIGDVYTITSDDLTQNSLPDHAAILLIHALRQAILDYESQKATRSFREALKMLQKYDEGLPERDLRTDYEY